MDLTQAMNAHGEWKVKLRAAIAKKEQLDSAGISLDNKCPLGQWLHGEARSKYATMKSYTDLLAKHAAFHKEAGRVAQVINEQKFAEAEVMLGGGKSYADASNNVAAAISTLKREAGL